jgi:DNA-binding response OmpR family regulator
MSPSTEPISDSEVSILSGEPNHGEPTATILVVGSPRSQAAAITELLRDIGYTVHRLPAVTPEALTRLEPALVLLATELSGIENARMCSQIRQVSTVPIIVLSEHNEETDKVLALELGADDYVILPVGNRELLARVRAQLRRAQLGRGELAGLQHIGAFTIDRLGRRICFNGNELRLSPKEFDLLAFLLNAPGRAFTREQLLREVWGYRYYGGIKTVDVHIRWLREKLAACEPVPFRITTLRGIGYRLDIL